MQLIRSFAAQTTWLIYFLDGRSKALRVFPLIVLILLGTVGVYCQIPQAAEMQLFNRMYLARDDGTGKAGDPATEFATNDIPIYCVVLLGSASPVTVKMNLVAVAVAGVKAETRVVSTSYTTKDNQDRVNFTGNPDKHWTAGKYRADIFIDGTIVKRLDFEIRKPQPLIKSVLSFQPKPPPVPKDAASKQN